jgi:hypothetical protein
MQEQPHSVAAMDSLSVAREGYRNCSDQELHGNAQAAVEVGARVPDRPPSSREFHWTYYAIRSIL